MTTDAQKIALDAHWWFRYNDFTPAEVIALVEQPQVCNPGWNDAIKAMGRAWQCLNRLT